MTPAVHAASSVPAILGWVLFLFAVGWSVRAAGATETSAGPDWKWWLLLAAVMLSFRWPLIWAPYELQPDESQLIAGAITLRHDPAFWRSVDGGTAGPFDFFPLLAAGFVAPPGGYAVARIMGVVLICGTLVFIGESLALIASRGVARLAVLPLLAFESFTTNAEFVHYSTELAPAFLLAAAIYALARQTVRPSVANVWLGAILLGAVPFSKLQAVPLAGVLGLFFAGFEIGAGRKSNLVRLIAGALVPLLAVVVLVAVTGQAENMLISFVLHNFEYVQKGESTATIALLQWQQSEKTGYLALLLVTSGVFFIGSLALARHAPRALRRWQLGALLLFVAAVVCVLTPGRNFEHYLNLLTLPLGCVLGSTLAIVLQPVAGATASRRQILAGVFLASVVGPQMALRASPWPDPYEHFNTADRGPATRELPAAVRAMTVPGEALGIWGWRCGLYVEAGLYQATRQAHNEAQLRRGRWQIYFLTRYLEDIQASNPPVFVDTMGPGNFLIKNRNLGLEAFPALHDWVSHHYTFMAEVDDCRIYVRNDRLDAARRAWPANPPKPQ